MVDGTHLISNAYAAKRTAPLLVSGATLHVLPAGSRFDLTRRTLVQHVEPLPDAEVAEVRAAESDLRGLARDIAAEGISPTHYARRLRRGRSESGSPRTSRVGWWKDQAGITDAPPRLV